MIQNCSWFQFKKDMKVQLSYRTDSSVAWIVAFWDSPEKFIKKGKARKMSCMNSDKN